MLIYNYFLSTVLFICRKRVIYLELVACSRADVRMPVIKKFKDRGAFKSDVHWPSAATNTTFEATLIVF